MDLGAKLKKELKARALVVGAPRLAALDSCLLSWCSGHEALQPQTLSQNKASLHEIAFDEYYEYEQQ